MSAPKTYTPYKIKGPAAYAEEIQAGINRAPRERAQAVRDFWNWVIKG